MAFDDKITRSETGELPVEVAGEVINGITRDSVVMRLAREVPVSVQDSRVKVLQEEPAAGWVSSGGLKSVSKADWDNAALVAEELAVVVVVDDDVFDDASFPIWAEVRPLLSRAFAKKLDDAALFGVDAPAGFGPPMVNHAIAAGNIVNSQDAFNEDNPVGALLEAARMVSEDGYIPNGAVWKPGMQYHAAALRSDALVANPIGSGTPFAANIAGLGIMYDPIRWNAAYTAIVADWTNVLFGVRKRITFELFRGGVLQNAEGEITHNLLQEDKTALRATARFAYRTVAPVTDQENGQPVAVVVPASGYGYS